MPKKKQLKKSPTYTALLEKEVIKGIKGVLGNRSQTIDFQRQRVYDFHGELNENIINVPVCNDIVKKLDRFWKIHTTALYPEKWDEDVAEGWALAKRYSAIQVPPSMLTLSYVAHEHAHGVLECFLNYNDTKIKDAGHGPLWVGILILDLCQFMDIEYEQIRNKMSNRNIHSVDYDTILKFRELFINT